MTSPKPIRCRVRMYQVGFGDCFLVSLEYPAPLDDGRDVRHILFDFGSTRRPTGWQSLKRIAEAIQEHTAGEIDIVVVSHRHKDHLSEFGDPELVQTFVAAGYPKLVVRSWTEHPDAAATATGGRRSLATVSKTFGPKSAALISQLRAAEGFAASLQVKLTGAKGQSFAAEVEQVADDQLGNAAAVEQLRTWAGSKGRYLHYGLPSGMEELVPGIKVRVLGPPTVDQHPAVARQRSRDPNEFWMLYERLVGALTPEELMDDRGETGSENVPDAAVSVASDAFADVTPARDAALSTPIPAESIGPAGPTRWLTNRMGRQNLNAMLRIVRILDDVLNNTSVILLMDVPATGGPLRLLFPGDAQIENWEYALKVAPDRESNLELLREVDLYKVGHHGSRNATPRTLFNLWTEAKTKDRPLVALMSTKPGVHGRSPATYVPRQTLVAALDTRTKGRLYSTERITAATPYVELSADLSKDRSLEVVTIGSQRATAMD